MAINNIVYKHTSKENPCPKRQRNCLKNIVLKTGNPPNMPLEHRGCLIDNFIHLPAFSKQHTYFCRCTESTEYFLKNNQKTLTPFTDLVPQRSKLQARNPRLHSLTRLKTRASFLKSECKIAPKRPQPPVIPLMRWCFPCLTLPSTLITSADFSRWLSPSSHSQQVPKIDHTLDDLRQLSSANTLHKGSKIIKDDLYALEIHLK